MAELCFRVGVDVVVGGRLHLLTGACDAGDDCDGGLGELVGGPPAVAQTPPLFFVSAWIGGKSKEVCVQELSKEGVADLRLPIREGDVDTVKISLTYNVHNPTPTPRGPRNYHLATTYIPTAGLLAMLREAPGGNLGACTQCVCLHDNFTKNCGVLKIANLKTNVAAVQSLRLAPSALNSSDRLTEAVARLGKRILEHVSRCEISPLNAGSQYTSGFTYLPMERQLSHYSILGMTFDQLDTPVDLVLTMYHAYQAVQSTGISVPTLAAMPSHELVLRFGNVLIGQTMSCERTSPYSSDLTFNRVGQVCKETEHMRRTLSSVAMLTQRVDSRYVRGTACAAAPLDQCIRTLQDATADYGELAIRPGMGMVACDDDCENLFQLCKQNANGLRRIYTTLLGTGAHESTFAGTLAAAMVATAAQHPQFAKVQAQHHAAMAPILIRLGRLLHTGDWSVELGVVSAKGPAFRADAPNPNQLSGHAAGISRVSCGDRMIHVPVEGTSYLRIGPPSAPGFANKLAVTLADGTCQEFAIHELATVIAQNVHDIAGISPDHRILGHLCSRPDCDPKELMLRCPFYVSAFYSSLRQGDTTLGCIPVDTNPPRQLVGPGRPLFGAPVMGLSLPTTLAVPIVPGMLAADERDEQEAAELCALLRQQATEVWSPEAPQAVMHTLLSYWEPVDAPEGDHLRADCHAFVRCENTWAFDNPDHTAMATRIYAELARRFNALQAKEPSGDGVRATAHGKYRSAALALTLPIPRSDAPFRLTCVRNIRRAVVDMGLQPLVGQKLKAARVCAQASIPSEHHIYMCTNGGGLVHAHRAKLA